MSPEEESKSDMPPKALVKDEEEGVVAKASVTGTGEQPELVRKYKRLTALPVLAAFLVISISANAGLTIAMDRH